MHGGGKDYHGVRPSPEGDRDDWPAREGPWAAFYEKRLLDHHAYFDYFKSRYYPFLTELACLIDLHVRETSTEPASILELGAGMGNTTRWLSGQYGRLHRFVAVDTDLRLIGHMKETLPSDCTVVRADIFRYVPLRRPTLVHSHGVIEHYSDAEIQRIIMSYSDAMQIHYVPGEGHGTPSFGDERLLPLRFWKTLLRTTHAFTFNGGKDYCLVIMPSERSSARANHRGL